MAAAKHVVDAGTINFQFKVRKIQDYRSCATVPDNFTQQLACIYVSWLFSGASVDTMFQFNILFKNNSIYEVIYKYTKSNANVRKTT